jgi:seryl-tRNA synthetase
MLDVRLLRSDLDGVKAAIASRGEDTSALDEIAALDESRRRVAAERDEIRSRVKGLSKQIGALHRDGRGDEAVALTEQSRELGEREKALDAEAEGIDTTVRDALLRIGNIPSVDCPEGASADDNVILRTEGFDPAGYGDHQKVPHWDFAVAGGLLDVERATKMSGAMFVMYRGLGARLARALVQLALDRNGDVFEEIRPPTLVRTETMISTGHLPKFADDAYHAERDDLWAIPTAEVPLTSLARDEILAETDLPKRLMAHTSCFRREAGSAGRDTRGLLRVHEFDKVEILAYTTPDQAADVQADLLARAESVIADLGLAYRIVDICTGDLGNSAARTWDVEVFAPGADRWLEVSSVSWFSDYQARRANIRYRPTESSGTAIVHTLNGSALAVPRVWAALTETHRRADGSIAVPECLRPYMGGIETIEVGAAG